MVWQLFPGLAAVDRDRDLTACDLKNRPMLILDDCVKAVVVEHGPDHARAVVAGQTLGLGLGCREPFRDPRAIAGES
jgi:hypothetical protein